MKYKRILLKLSGEALAGDKGFGFDYDIMSEIGKSIKACSDLGVQIAIVVGGGNFWRGRDHKGMDETRSGHIGMLATTMNALAVADVLEQLGCIVRVQTAITMQEIAEPYIRNRAVRHLEKGRIVIFGCGTGSPFFSTDTAASLRAAEINAEVIFKATMVDGVYDKDPKKYKDAIKYDNIKLTEIIEKRLEVIDSTAATMCHDNHIPMIIFNINNPANLKNVIEGKKIGTVITSSATDK